MDQIENKVVIDSVSAHILDKYSKDEVILVGVLPYEDSSYSDNLELVIKPETGYPITLKLPYSGYNMQLFVGDFTEDEKEEIMIRGSFGGSGGFEIGVIYKLIDDNIKEIFNQNDIVKNSPCTSKFKDNYKVHVSCGNKKYSINLSNRPKDYLDLIYDSNGRVKPESIASVDYPNTLYPVKDVDNDYYELLIQQRIVGINNADTLGIIQSLCNLLDEKLTIVTKGIYFPFNSDII